MLQVLPSGWCFEHNHEFSGMNGCDLPRTGVIPEENRSSSEFIRWSRLHASNTLDRLHVIEEMKIIYNVHYCRAGVGFIFYDEAKAPRNEKDWRVGLSVDRYYPSFEEAVDAEYKRLVI